MHLRFPALVALLVALAPVTAHAQKVPERPKLPQGADTNDAQAYFRLGASLLTRNSRTAADAFYWASRIDPTLASPWYGRRVALLLADPKLERYMRGERRAVQDLRGVDSLLLRALSLDPTMFREFDKPMLEHYYQESFSREIRRETGRLPNQVELSHYIDSWLQNSDAWTRGWLAYGDRDFDTALRQYAIALKSARNKGAVAAERGRIFLMRGDADSAVAQLRYALEELRKREDKDEVVLYNSKALIEHALGRAFELRNQSDSAKEAYGRALQEDLAYYPAHVALASLALAQSDTAGALSEYELAVQLRGDEPRVRVIYGFALTANGKLDEAAEQFSKAAELEPYFAIPHRWLGQIAERRQQPDKAVEHYRRFLSLASTAHPLRQEVQARLQAVGAPAGGAP